MMLWNEHQHKKKNIALRRKYCTDLKFLLCRFVCHLWWSVINLSLEKIFLQSNLFVGEFDLLKYPQKNKNINNKSFIRMHWTLFELRRGKNWDNQ